MGELTCMGLAAVLLNIGMLSNRSSLSTYTLSINNLYHIDINLYFTGMLTVRPVLELALVARLVASPPPGLRDLKRIIQM